MSISDKVFLSDSGDSRQFSVSQCLRGEVLFFDPAIPAIFGNFGIPGNLQNLPSS